MLKGTIYATTDENMVWNTLRRRDPNLKVVTISERFNDPNAIDGIILMPPSEAVRYNLNGDKIGFQQMYRNYLYSQGPAEFISAMIKSLIVGHNILLYLTRDEYKAGFFNILFEYFKSLGIFIGNKNQKFFYDIRQDPVIADMLYLNGFLNVKEFMTLMPQGVYFSKMALNKLEQDLPLDTVGKTIDEIAIMYFTYKENIKKNKNKFLQPLFVRS